MSEVQDLAAEAALQQQVLAILHRHRLHAFTVAEQHLIRNKQPGNTELRHMYSVKDFTTKALYPQQHDNPYAAFFPEIVRVFRAEGENRAIFTNFTSSTFPHMRDDWRAFLTKYEFKTPNDVHHLDHLFGLLAAAVVRELSSYGMEDTQENFDRLLHVRMALNNFVSGVSTLLFELPDTLVEWLKSDIPIPVLLFAFDRGYSRGFVGKLQEPLIPMDEAKDAMNIPFSQLRTLYAQEPSNRWSF